MEIRGQMRGVAATISALAQVPSLLEQAAVAGMTRGLEHLSQVLRSEFLSGPYPQRLEWRSGRFRASFRRGDRQNIFKVEAQGNRVTGTLGSTAIQARILDEGGTIRPKRGQFLAVPTGFIMTGRGAAAGRGSVREEYRRPLREIPRTFFVRTATAGLVLWQALPGARRRGRRLSEVAIPIYRLVKSVFIEGRRYLAQAAARAEPQVQAIVRAQLQQVVDRANQLLQRVRG